MLKMPGVYVAETDRVSLAGADLPPAAALPVYTRAEFGDIVGRWPVGTELEDMNCPDAGLIGHLMCGCCIIHQLPRKVCGCLAPIGAPTDNLPRIRVATADDPCAVGVDLERIEGWPGLDAFPEARKRMGEMLLCAGSDAMRAAVEAIVLHLLCELVQRGALVRSWKDDRRWIYDGRSR